MFGMSSCDDVAQRASEYLDGELAFRERLLLRLHLAMCKGCKGFVSGLRQVINLAPGLCPEVGGPEAEEDVDRLLGEALT